MTTSTLHTPLGDVQVDTSDQDRGSVFLVLHGGGGAQTVAGLAGLLIASPARVVTPTHPGFGGTPRPEDLTDVRGLAALYNAVLDELDVTDVTVVGSSLGGWIAAEMGLLGSARLIRLVLVDAVGIEVPSQPIADFFSLTLDELAELSWHEPDAFRMDPSAMSDAQKAAMAGNRAALAVYGDQPGQLSMADPTLRHRLAAVSLPTLVLWGDSDQIVTPDYGRAYAQAIPGARFQLLADAGHLPQVETPQQLVDAITAFTTGHSR